MGETVADPEGAVAAEEPAEEDEPGFVDWFMGRAEPTKEPVFSSWEATAYGLFGDMAADAVEDDYDLREDLEQARMITLPEVHVATVWLNTLVAAVVGVAAVIGLQLTTSMLGIALPAPMNLIVYAVPAIAAGGAYLGGMILPSVVARSRGKRLDWRLPYASNFIAAMAAANATPEDIFKSLAEQEEIYGEVSREAAWIYRDTAVLGKDTLTALKHAVRRSPSEKWKDFLQGIVSTLTSGGDLKLYFLSRAEDQMKGMRQDQKDFLEGLALLGETYVVVAVATPLFLIVMMSIMMWISGRGTNAQGLFLLIVFVLLPVIHTAYAFAIYASKPGG